MLDLKPCNCGGVGTVFKWSGADILFIMCNKCGLTTDDVIREQLDWAEIAVIREWNRLQTINDMEATK